MAQRQGQKNKETPEKRVVKRVHLFLEEAFGYVDPDRLNQSEEWRFALSCFALGTIHAFVESEKLTPPQVHAIFIRLLDKLFKWPMESTVEVAQMVIDGTGEPTVREIMIAGMEAITAWEGGQGKAAMRLAQVLEEISIEE